MMVASRNRQPSNGKWSLWHLRTGRVSYECSSRPSAITQDMDAALLPVGAKRCKSCWGSVFEKARGIA